ncbi:type II toxin-antitoxin system RelE/ParE family toxin [Sphingobium sp. PNB]|uniref:type II toxin-antitoxin system RelE/ParE family toxin n=1 Tax=Sphingobium sp. PNB TaxID=863934 RepID=UPI001CA43018|nr:type II toxin-antitoxin system RelE/ParE family toxin [Sphingobium sp. PNB]MCB4859593.1 type II toxin-antitoxin system RelE/ParE family toxin [Sphingobium sp. PNB]
MPSYTLSKAAENDIAAIATYTVDTFGVEQAITYRDGLIRTFEFLAEFPRVARERPELRQRSRVYPYQSHLIFYRFDGDDILIQRIRHSREDWMASGDEPS